MFNIKILLINVINYVIQGEQKCIEYLGQLSNTKTTVSKQNYTLLIYKLKYQLFWFLRYIVKK